MIKYYLTIVILHNQTQTKKACEKNGLLYIGMDYGKTLDRKRKKKKYKMHKLFVENATITISHASINVKVLLHHLLDVDTREEFLCITCQYLNA